MSKHILSKTPTELQYVGRSVFMKEVKTRHFWTFELGTQKGIDFPIWVIVGFQQRDRQNLQNLNENGSYRPPVTNDQ